MFIAKFDVRRSAAMDSGSALVELKACIPLLFICLLKILKILILEKKCSSLAQTYDWLVLLLNLKYAKNVSKPMVSPPLPHTSPV